MWIAIALLSIGQLFLFWVLVGHIYYHTKIDRSVLESALKAALDAELYEEAAKIKEQLRGMK